MSDRQRRILDVIAHRGFATIHALARDFDVSAQTIRREVIWLSSVGVLQRFHGGAGLADGAVRLGYVHKASLSADNKRRIAVATARLLAPGVSLFIDVGTTAELVAQELPAGSGLRVFTPSLTAAARLSNKEGVDIFVTGGTVQGADGSLVGETAIASIFQFRVDFAIIGCSAFDIDGAPMDFDIHKVAAKRAMIARARQCVVVADAAKFEKTALMRITEPHTVHRLVTDRRPSGALAAALAQHGIELLIA